MTGADYAYNIKKVNIIKGFCVKDRKTLNSYKEY